MAKKCLLILVAGLVLTSIAWAQEMATIQGTVLDPNGDPLPGVQITIGTQTEITDEDGAFTIEALPGNYTMVAALEGFTLAEREITLTAEGLDLDMTMSVAVRETVTVTGSFIPGQVLEEGAAPIKVLDLSDYQDRGLPDFEEVIRQMPEMYGHANVANQYTASTYNIGMRSANIRGLGPQRNLVLLNGRRSILNPVSVEQGGAVDIAAFPKIALKRVEVLKEASPLYGSDAITGVFNYITDDRFTGLKVDLGYTDMEDSDGDFYAGVMKGWEVGPLNLIFAIEYNERNSLRIFDKDWYYDRTSGGDGSWAIGSSGFGQPGGFFGLGPTPTGPGVRAMTTDPACGTTHPETRATSFGNPYVPYNCYYYYTHFTNLIEPQERINIFTQFTLEVSDKQEVYGHVMFSRNNSVYMPSPTYPPTNPDAAWWWFAPPGTSYDTSPSYYIPPHNPGMADYVSSLPPEQQANFAYGAYFTGRTVAISGLTNWGALTQEWPRRQHTWQLMGGLRGEWGSGPKAVHYDFAASYGSLNHQIDGHDIINERWAAANWGLGGPDCDPATGTPGVAPCYFWNNFYTGFSSSDPALQNRQDVFEWMLGDTGSRTKSDELYVYADFSGATGLELGGGPMAWAAGYEYYYNEGTLDPQGQSYTDSIYDENPFGFLWLNFPYGFPHPVETDRHAAYAELLLPFAETFELGLAARYTKVPWLNTDHTKGRASARWTPVPQLVLRGSFSQGLIIPSPWQLNRWDRYVANMGGGNFIPIEVPPATQTGGLEPEEADSVNFGFVWHPVSQVTISADYWQIDFTNPIVRQTPSFVVNNIPEQVEWTPLGTPGRVYTFTVNGPDLDARGYDFGFNWDIHSSAGLFSLGFDGALLDKYTFAAHEGLQTPEFDALGKLNGRIGNSPVLVYATPELKYNAYVGWQKGRHSLNVMYHHVDGYANTRTNPDYAPPTPELEQVGDFNTFDVYYALRIPSWHTTFRISVLNAGDEDPPVVYNEYTYDTMTHNPIGRRVKVGVSYQF